MSDAEPRSRAKAGLRIGEEAAVWPLACPACGASLPRAARAAAGQAGACGACGHPWSRRADGIVDLLGPVPPDLARFLREYAVVRRAEGRGALGQAWYRALPAPSPGDPLAWQWRLRARTIAGAERSGGALAPASLAGRRVLDLGAGCGWLAARLARRGAEALAVDLSLDEADGLPALRHFAEAPRVVALRGDLRRLPLASGCAELIVFNASLHYAPSPAGALTEALRVLAPVAGARILVLDSPVYPRAADGEAMVAERKARYRARHGFASDALGSREFLVADELAAMAVALGLHLRARRVWRGARWALRPWRARLSRRRTPARFPLLELRRAAPEGPRAAGGRML